MQAGAQSAEHPSSLWKLPGAVMIGPLASVVIQCVPWS